jgi:hypothetical protein
MIHHHEFDYDTVELVLHSLNRIANDYLRQNDEERAMKYFKEKEFILESLLDPVEIHVIEGKKYIAYEGGKHKYHEPFGHFSEENRKKFIEKLPVKEMDDFPLEGPKIKGYLTEKVCNEFYNMVKKDKFRFIPPRTS